jgi:hypothetical protein
MFADARGRQLSSTRSGEPRSLPSEFYVSVRPEEDAYVRLVLYGSDGSRYELPTAPDVVTSQLPAELLNLGPYRLEEDREPSRVRLDVLILSSSREIPPEAVGERLLPANLSHPAGDERTRELQSLAQRAREDLGCFAEIVTLSPDSP